MNLLAGGFANPGMGGRVRAIRGSMNQKDFCRIAGTSQGNLSKIEKGMVPDVEILLRISEYGKTTVEYLLTGKDALKVSIVAHDGKNLPPGMSLIKKLKGAGSAGRGLKPDNKVDIQLAFRDDWLAKFGGPGKLVALFVEGDSMEPTLMDGDIVVMDKNVREVEAGGGIYALIWNGKRMIKRLQANPKTRVLLVKSDNPKYDVLEANVDDVVIEGKLIWFGREMK